MRFRYYFNIELDTSLLEKRILSSKLIPQEYFISIKPISSNQNTEFDIDINLCSNHQYKVAVFLISKIPIQTDLIFATEEVDDGDDKKPKQILWEEVIPGRTYITTAPSIEEAKNIVSHIIRSLYMGVHISIFL
jgi:hypothetical protein